MRTLVSSSAGSTIVDKVKLYEGGTSNINAPAALAALGGVPLNLLNQPNGVAGLDANGKLLTNNLPLSSISTVAVEGPASVMKGSTTTYTVTNHDVFTEYLLQPVSGMVNIDGNGIIQYIAPSIAQAGGFTINGRTIGIAVVDFMPTTPVLTVFSTGAGSVASLNCASSAYTVTGGNYTHLNSDWQVATDSNFSNIVSQSIANTSNKVAWTSADVAVATVYYIRMRHRDSNNTTSNWSNTVTHTTKAIYSIETEEAKLVPNDKSGSDMFSRSVSLSGDGTRVAIGAYYADPNTIVNAGAVYIFVRSNNTWTLEAKLAADDKATVDSLGSSICMNDNGSRIVVGSPGNDPSGTANAGAAYVFSRINSTWTQEAKLVASDKAANDIFGESVAISADASRIVVGANRAMADAISQSGAAYVFLRSGTVWSQEAKLSATDKASGDGFGSAVAINSDGSRIVIGAEEADVSSFVNAGAAYVYLRTGVNWAQEAKLVSTTLSTFSGVGASVAISQDASRIAVGSIYSGSGVAVSAAYIFLRTGTTWAQEAKLQGSDTIAGDRFGCAVALSNNGANLIVGASVGAPAGLNNAGVAYVYTRTNAVWTQRNKLTASDKAVSDFFGEAVSINADGTRAIIGTVDKAGYMYRS